MVRPGHRWEDVVLDRGPDEGGNEVQGVDPHGLWAGETEPGGGGLMATGCDQSITHELREMEVMNSLDPLKSLTDSLAKRHPTQHHLRLHFQLVLCLHLQSALCLHPQSALHLHRLVLRLHLQFAPPPHPY